MLKNITNFNTFILYMETLLICQQFVGHGKMLNIFGGERLVENCYKDEL